MAYKGAYNPDALPAHAEPEQAAQLLGAMRVSKPNQPQPQPQLQNRGHHPAQSGPPARKVSPNPPPPPKDYPPVSSATSPAPTTHPLYQKHGMDTNNSRLYSPPPPQNYGSGPRPVPAQNRPPPTSHPPRSPQPPQASPPGMPKSDDPRDLFPLFRAANSSNTGSLSRTELGSALVNGDYTSFDPYTVTMMIRMFDRDGNGTVGFDEFVALWRFLAAWRELFVRFDEDNSGRISLQEFTNALAAFGYRLSQPFIGLMFTTFESKGRGKAGPISGQKDGMSFDLFVQACITLKRMTDAFKRYDDDRDGYITLSFEEFLTEVLRLRE